MTTEQLKINDLVFVNAGNAGSRIIVTPIYGYKIDGSPLIDMKGAQSLNLIVGANNSGKSRFIRQLLKLEFRLITNVSWQELTEIINEIKGILTPIMGAIDNYINNHDLNKPINNQSGNLSTYLYNIRNKEKQAHAKAIIDRIEKVQYLKLDKSIYIPALRTAHTLFDGDGNPLSEDYFSNTLNKNYPEINSISRGGVVDVFTGINLYEEIRKARNSIREVRGKFDEFEKFLSDNFYEGKEVDVVALDEDGTRRINIHIDGVEDDKDIHELGDGIQAIITLMYKIFMADENTLIVIDEPELHLHPGFQRIFMQAILKLLKERNNNTIIFIVTHSNHLMDLTLTQESVGIYSFSKDKDGKGFSVRACKAGDYSLLSELGVNSSSAFIANTSIWVEGPTDRKYLNFFLKKYFEKEKLRFKEDIDYAFYEYGGSLLAHYDFNEDAGGNEELVDKIKSFSLANRIFLLADMDSTTSDGADEKSKRLQVLEKIASKVDNFSFNKTDGIEIENMLPEKVLKKYVHTLYKGNDDESPSVRVKKNIEDDIKGYKREKIGTVLQNAIKPNSLRKGIKNYKKFKSTNGGLNPSYKNNLCEYVCGTFANESYEELVNDNSGLDKLVKELSIFIANR